MDMVKSNNSLEQNLNQLNSDMLKQLERKLEICKESVKDKEFEKISLELYNKLERDILKKLQNEFPNDITNDVIANKYLQSVWAIYRNLV